MKKITNSLRKGIISLAGALLLGSSFPSHGQSTEFTYNAITNNTTLIPVESIEYKVQASSSGNGSVSGNIDDWIDVGSNATITANADAHYKFSYWSGLPSGANTTNNPCTFAVDNVYTNVVANFIPKTNITEEVGFSAIKSHGNIIDLEIPSTFTNSLYSIYSNTNLLHDTWLAETNKWGNNTNLWFNLPMDKAIKFYRGTATYEEQ